MIFIARQEPFTCDHCGRDIEPLPKGSYRNHCPFCLRSKHVDKDGPGDRAAACGGVMDPSGVDHDGKRGWLILHKCRLCGKVQPNKCAPDDDMGRLTKDSEDSEDSEEKRRPSFL